MVYERLFTTPMVTNKYSLLWTSKVTCIDWQMPVDHSKAKSRRQFWRWLVQLIVIILPWSGCLRPKYQWPNKESLWFSHRKSTSSYFQDLFQVLRCTKSHRKWEGVGEGGGGVRRVAEEGRGQGYTIKEIIQGFFLTLKWGILNLEKCRLNLCPITTQFLALTLSTE